MFQTGKCSWDNILSINIRQIFWQLFRDQKRGWPESVPPVVFSLLRFLFYWNYVYYSQKVLYKKNTTVPKVQENLDRYIDMSMDICHDVCGLTGPNRENAGASRYSGKFQGTCAGQVSGKFPSGVPRWLQQKNKQIHKQSNKQTYKYF